MRNYLLCKYFHFSFPQYMACQCNVILELYWTHWLVCNDECCT